MSEVLLMMGVSAAAFVSTNLDNLFLLMALQSDGQARKRDVALGYACAIALVLLLGLAASYAADFAVDGWLRFLGLVPIGLGLWRLGSLVRGRSSNEMAAPAAVVGTSNGALPVFGTMLANSGDSLGVFASLMAETSELLVLVVLITSVAMACGWTAVARWVVEHPSLAPRLQSIDRYAVPALLIAVGLYILTDTPTDTV